MDDFQQRRRGVRALRGETTHLHKKTFLQQNGICVDKEGKESKQTYLRPDHSLEDGIQLIWAEVVPVKIIKKVLDPEDAKSPQVLQRTNAACSELQITDNTCNTHVGNTAESWFCLKVYL